MNQQKLQRFLPLAAVVLTAAYFGYQMWPNSDRAGDFHYRKFGELPAIDKGRQLPLDTSARMNLMVITHRQQLYQYDAAKLALLQPGQNPGTWIVGSKEYSTLEEAADAAGVSKRYYPATKWFLDAMTTPLPKDIFQDLFPERDVAYRHKVFRIENDDVLRLLKLERAEGLRYSIIDIAPGFETLRQEAFRVMGDEDNGVKGVDPKNMTLLDAKVMELWQHLNLFMKTAGLDAPLIIPNRDGSDQWTSFRSAHFEFNAAFQARRLPDDVDAQTYAVYRDLLDAYAQGNKADFNATLAKHLAQLRQEQPERMRAIRVEMFFNEFAPFYHCLLVYVVIALIGAISWIIPDWTASMQRAAYGMMALTFVVHISGLILRMYLQDRMFVFVTNLYSSAVFIGLGCVAVCLITEWFYRNGIAIVVGSTTGFCTLIIAHMLSLSGDTLEMMQAVLDTNFWLATHVTCITLGYTAAFVAGGMGIAYILLGLFTNMLRKEGSANLARMTYGVLCAGMFLSFVGTVLGGLWADYSWGRFWGWDPKENGALLIVIWIALILHARWGGLVKHRGIAVLSVLGIVITSWSWFGTNFLGVGLHSYGFRQGAMTWLIMIDLGFMAIAGLGLIPLENWQSFRAPSTMNHAPMQAKPTMA